MIENIPKKEKHKGYGVRTVYAMNASVGVTFAVTVAASLVHFQSLIALAIAALFLVPVTLIAYVFK